MALPPATQGARNTPALITWVDTDGTPKDLSGATITGRIENRVDGVDRAADGSFALVDAANGVFSWTYGVLDVGTPGNFFVQFKATFGGSAYDISHREEWDVYVAI